MLELKKETKQIKYTKAGNKKINLKKINLKKS